MIWGQNFQHQAVETDHVQLSKQLDTLMHSTPAVPNMWLVHNVVHDNIHVEVIWQHLVLACSGRHRAGSLGSVAVLPG